jgi:hypothetical protein
MRKSKDRLTFSSPLRFDQFCLITAIESALAFLVMLVIPGDPKNAWLFGFSRTRAFIILLFLALTLIFGSVALWLRKGGAHAAAWQGQFAAGLTRPVPVILLTVSALLGMGATLWGIAPALRHMLGADLMTRLLPPLVWGLVFCIQLLVFLVPVWKNILENQHKPKGDAIRFELNSFLMILVYAGVLFLLMGLVVQLAFFTLSPSTLDRFINPKDFTTLYIKFNLSNENNIPNYYSSFILLVLAVQFFWIARGCKQQKIAWSSRWNVLGWVALFFSMEEIANLHFYLIEPVRNMLHTGGIWRNAWHLPFLPAFFLLLLWCVPLIRELSSSQKIKVALAFIFGIAGMLMMILLSEAAFLQTNEQNVGSELFHVAEKAMEYLGVWLMIAVANEKMLQYMPEASFEVTAPKKMTSQNSHATFQIFYKRLPWILISFVVFFALVNLALDFFYFIPALKSAQNFFPVTAQQTLENIFNLEVETAPPTYFSCLLLLMVSIILAIIAAQRNFKSEPGWGILSAIFLFLSMDEAASLHELLFDVVTAYTGQPSGILHYAWYIPVIPALVIFGLLYLRFWLRLPVFERIFFVVSAGIYLYGVIGMEAVSGWMDELWGVNSLIYNIAMTIEETMEMGGMILFIYTLLHYLAGWKPKFTIQLQSKLSGNA